MATTSAATTYAHITKEPTVCGGVACIDGTRIRVMDVVCLLKEGRTPEQMLEVFSVSLTLGQVHAALAYYYDHRDEIEAAFAEEDDIEAESARRWVESLKRAKPRLRD